MTTLIIAEKPSVARDIAKALGGFTKDGNFWVNDEMVIGSAVGHLLELKAPDAYEVKRGKWLLKNLPVLPPQFELSPIKSSRAKFLELKKKLRSKAVTDVINACDAGREGELIFRYIMQASFEGTRTIKPIRRLWLQSMTAQSIRRAFQQLRSDEEMKPLEAAARCRSEADWIVGINGTRALTAFNSLDGGFVLTTVGRVQTPTLALVVSREKEIQSFCPQSYWEVHAEFSVPEGVYKGIYQCPDVEKNAERVWDREQAIDIAKECCNKVGFVTEKKKRTRMSAPALFDLTSLQREANARFGFSAQTTLSIAQSLYERHKMITYPRTDAKALPEDYVEASKGIMQSLQEIQQYHRFCHRILKKRWIKPNPRIFDNKKISDHFAIIPTGETKAKLNEVEEKLYDLIVRRFLGVFYPAARYDVTTRYTVVEKYTFKSEGKILVVPGWLVLRNTTTNLGSELPALPSSMQALVQKIDVVQDRTRPPARYTEATLLSAMEGAGKKLDDDVLREAMTEKGLGTPATRASIIEGLIAQKYIQRDERSLVPSSKAFQLMSLLKGLKLGQLCDPRLTGEWEYKLAMIEKKVIERDDFMKEIRDFTAEIIAKTQQYEGNTVPVENPYHCQAKCPQCGGEMIETYRHYKCQQCNFSIQKVIAGRLIESAEVEELLAQKEVGPLEGFYSKRGFSFDAKLKLEWDERSQMRKVVFDFGEEKKTPQYTQEDLGDKEVLGTCPLCGSPVYHLADRYVCQHRLLDKACEFRISKKILEQEITVEQIQKLLQNGKTDVLDGFVSKKTNRPFKASLVIDAKKGVSFVFPEIEKKATTSKKLGNRK